MIAGTELTHISQEQYVGVSGVANTETFALLVDAAVEIGLLDDARHLGVGVYATGRSQQQYKSDSQYPKLYPIGSDIGEAAGNEDSGLTETMVQLSRPTQETARGWASLYRIALNRTIAFARGMQLNAFPVMPPESLPVWEVTTSHDYDIVLPLSIQIGTQVMLRHHPDAAARRLCSLAVETVVFHAPGEQGQPLDPTLVRPFIDAIYQRGGDKPGEHMRVAVSGGLSAETLPDAFGPLLGEFTDLSCDASRSLCTGIGRAACLNPDRIMDYLRAWRQLVPQSTLAQRQAEAGE